MFLSPNEQIALSKDKRTQDRINRLLQVRTQSKQNSINKTHKYTKCIATEYETKLTELRESYETAKTALVMELMDDYNSVDLGRGQIDAGDARKLGEDRRVEQVEVEETRQATQHNLNNIAAASLKRVIVPRDTTHLDIERERSRQIVALHTLTLADPVCIEPRKTSRPLGKATDFTDTAHHRSVAVVRTKPAMTADVAAGGAARLAEGRRREKEADRELWERSNTDRFAVAVNEIERQKNKTRLLKTLGDTRAQDVKRKQENGILIKSKHSLYGVARQRVANEAFSKRFVDGGLESKLVEAKKGVRREWSEASSMGSIGFVKF